MVVRLRALLSEVIQFFLDFMEFGAGAPDMLPVHLGSASRSGPDDLEHPLGWIGTGRTRVSDMTLEIVNEDAGIVTDVTYKPLV